ncbi:hybrid sensor histidine kinase/response regulator transcription factor [Pontiella agarivorans]|nr:ATP-binding protein [Pontiella agarivorans]
MAAMCFAAAGCVGEPAQDVSVFQLPRAREKMRQEADRLKEQLAGLPKLQEPLQLDAYGYHGGYLPALDTLPDEPRWTVDLQFSTYAKFEQIILVPAIDRSASPLGSYGFPKRFRVLQVFPDGRRTLIKEWMAEDCPDPGRVPLILEVEAPGTSRLVLEVYRGSPEGEKELFALDEIFGIVKNWAWSARSVEVSSELGSPPYWGKEYLIDRKTSLGLPVGLPVEDCAAGGGFSVVFDAQPEERSTIEIDLGKSVWVGDITLFPAIPEEGVLIPGFGFPGKIQVIRQIASPSGERKRRYPVSAGWDGGNPGNNMIRIPVNSHGRWFRLMFSQLPVYDGRPVLALGEIQVHQSDIHYPVEAIRLNEFPEGSELKTHLLTDGKANGRPVMGMLEWLIQIARRDQLAKTLNGLAGSEELLAERWQNFWWWSAIAGGFILVVSALWVAVAALIQRKRSLMEMNRRAEIEQMKIRFFTHISHELRTPLTVILGPLEKMREMITEPAMSEYASLMHRNVKKLQQLVDQLLDFRKLQEKRDSLDWKGVDLALFVHNVFDCYRSLALDKKIRYHLIGAEHPLSFVIDPGKFQKILDNLISNALKYTPEGGDVTVKLAVEFGAVSTIRLEVEDSGVGIAAEDFPHVFEQFYRAEGLQPIQAGGSGIGLALVKELVDFWGGDISVESPLAHGRGTRFSVALPAPDPEAWREEAEDEVAELQPVDLPAPLPVAQAARPQSTETVLIADDNEDVRSFVRMELADHYQVIEAGDGEDGLQKARETIPDLVISDVMMPKMNGVEMCRRLKGDELTSHIPIVMLTARGSEEHQLEGLGTGADDYVTKPFSMPLLKARIQNLLESRRVMRERFARELTVEPSAITVTSVDEKLLQSAIGVVEEHMDDAGFTVERFAAEMHMARNTLLLKLRALVDQSPQEFIRTLRLKRARQLLEQNAGTIAEIAFQVGFEEPTHFSRSFKKQFGQTPSGYLKNRKFYD